MPSIHRPSLRVSCAVLACALCVAAADPPAEWKPALDHISAQSLRGHLSFIASSQLEGRNTPSRGLDLAAEYIAAQFRRAGLEPVGDDGYFQTANLRQLEAGDAGFRMEFTRGEETIAVKRDETVPRAAQAVELSAVPVYRVAGSDATGVTREQVRGRAVVIDGGRGGRAVAAALQKLEPAVMIRLARGGPPMPPAQFVEAGERPAGVPAISIFDADAVEALRALGPGPADWKLTVRLPAARETPARARNVIGLLRGSDPALQETYVLLTAHYDHLGIAKSGQPYNGANDDGSGTVSVIEVASALAALPHRPKRSIIFMTVFGEEEGLVGSQYYARHPVFPLDRTVANINLEQLGRTDAGEGRQLGRATFTGFEYSDVPAIFQKAGEMAGVKVYEASGGDNQYFARSDNLSFAEHGVPAHTMLVAAEFPDYHAVGDDWQKIDYDNLARVDRMLALGLLLIADNPQAPRWNEAKAGRYAHSAGN